MILEKSDKVDDFYFEEETETHSLSALSDVPAATEGKRSALARLRTLLPSCVTCGAEAMEEEEEGKGSGCACLDRGKGTTDDGILNYARSCIQIRYRATLGDLSQLVISAHMVSFTKCARMSSNAIEVPGTVFKLSTWEVSVCSEHYRA